MEKGEVLKTREWTDVSMPIEYIDYILDAMKNQKYKGCVSEFIRDAIREKLLQSKVRAPKYDTVLERYEKIS